MNGPYTRRTFAVLTSAVLLTAAAACSSDDSSGGAKDTLTFATDQVPQCMDPAVSPQDVTALIGRNIFDSLVNMTSDGKFHPWLADKWTISPDGKAYTFFLKQGVTFSDGTPLNAAAVKASIDHIVDPKTKSIYAARLISAYDSTTVVDDHTVKIQLKHASTPFLQVLSTAYLGIQNPATFKTPGAACVKPAGSGPFTLTNWTKNVQMVLQRNPKYDWGPAVAAHTGPAHLSQLTIKFITEDSSRFGALTSGQVDVIDDVPPANAQTLKSTSGMRYVRAEVPGAVYTTFFNTSTGPLADELVRKALLRSVDLDTLVRTASFGQFERAWSVLSPSTIGYDKEAAGAWKYDPATANRLLDQAGWTGRDSHGYRTKNGKELVLRWPYIQQFLTKFTVIAQGMQAQAKQVGIKLDYNQTDAGTFGKKYAQRDLDMYTTSFVRAEPDILRLFFTTGQSSSKGGGNIMGVTVPELDRLLDGAETSTNQAERINDYIQAQKYISAHALALPGYVPADLLGYSDKVHGLTFEPNAYPLFYDATVG